MTNITNADFSATRIAGIKKVMADHAPLLTLFKAFALRQEVPNMTEAEEAAICEQWKVHASHTAFAYPLLDLIANVGCFTGAIYAETNPELNLYSHKAEKFVKGLLDVAIDARHGFIPSDLTVFNWVE